MRSLYGHPILKPLFTERLPHHGDHLTWFTAESFGGPDRFTRESAFNTSSTSIGI